MDSKTAARLPPIDTLSFFNSLAFGVVVPVIYFMIELPHAGWIAILFTIEITGRLLGRPICERAGRKLGTGRSLAILQLLNALSYALLALVGFLRPSQTTGFAIIYASRVIGSMASASLPSVRPVNPDRGNTRGMLSTQQGFAFGCVLALLLGNRKPIADSILQTGGLLVPGIVAATLSLFAALVASQVPNEPATESSGDSASQSAESSVLQTGLALGVMFACESAFSMILCVLPLTDKEILAFTPATLALYFACMAFVSATSSRLLSERQISPAIALNLGMLLSAIGFAGFSIALWLSWKFIATDGVRLSYRTMLGAGLITAVGHGMLRISLPWVKPQRKFPLNASLAIVSIISVLFVSQIWAGHERASLAVGGVLLLAALPLGIALAFASKPKSARQRGFEVVGARSE